MISLEQRDRQPELMDQPGLDTKVHRRALDGMKRVNALSRTASVLWEGLNKLGLISSVSPLRILDIAAGGGDVVIRLAQLARQNNTALTAHGCDISPTAVTYAQVAAQRAGVPDVRFYRLDALQEALPIDYDVLMCTLFLHHLDEPNARALLQNMAGAARKAVLVDDLVRSRFGYFVAWAGGRLLTRSPIIHTDGPLSVRAAFCIEDVRSMANAAGLTGATFRRHWPQRFLFAWRK